MDEGAQRGFAGTARTWFALASALAADEVDTSYWTYFGFASEANVPDGDGNNVFVVSADFESDFAPFATNGACEDAVVQNTIVAAGGGALRVSPGATAGAGLHVDVALDGGTWLFRHWPRTDATGASLRNYGRTPSPSRRGAEGVGAATP
jgi:hypothetical protein